LLATGLVQVRGGRARATGWGRRALLRLLGALGKQQSTPRDGRWQVPCPERGGVI